MSKISDHLNALAAGNHSTWLRRARWLEDNKFWLKKSGDIALDIITVLRSKNISKAQLAENLKVAPQQMSKWLSGNENMPLNTICRIERALDVDLIKVTAPGSFEDSFTAEISFSGSEECSSSKMYTVGDDDHVFSKSA